MCLSGIYVLVAQWCSTLCDPMDCSPKGGREADRTEELNTGTYKCTVEDFSIIIEKEVGVFLEFPSFPCDPRSVGKLIFGSSAFCKPSLYIWKFSHTDEA